MFSSTAGPVVATSVPASNAPTVVNVATAANVVLSTRPARSGATALWISDSTPAPAATPGAPTRTNNPT
jgi:hypothetical protein